MPKQTVCIKIGGSTLDNAAFYNEFGAAVKKLADKAFPVIVHGGGKDIARNLDLLKKEFTFVEGMRVTDAQTVGVVQMVLSGDVNKRLVNALLVNNVQSLGLSGVDCSLLTAEKMTIKGQDIGFVGTITRVNTSILDICKQHNVTPVISPISRDNAGQIYNVNADLAAAEVAIALKTEHLVFVSDVPGVKINGAVISELRIGDIERYIADEQITGGMIPKVRSSAEAVGRGVGKVHICGWKDISTLVDELDVKTSSGTVIY